MDILGEAADLNEFLFGSETDPAYSSAARADRDPVWRLQLLRLRIERRNHRR
jgi:hypothetical protein